MWKYNIVAIKIVMGKEVTCGICKCINNSGYEELAIGNHYTFVANKDNTIDILVGGIAGRRYPTTCISLVSWSTKDGCVGRNNTLYDEYTRSEITNEYNR